MTERPLYDEPSKVEAEDGTVKVDGPDDVHVDLTPEAALETSDRLLAKSQQASGQLLFLKRGQKGPMKREDRRP